MGWPISKELGGFFIRQLVISSEQGTKVSEIDSHPNKKGQEKITEFIYDRLG